MQDQMIPTGPHPDESMAQPAATTIDSWQYPRICFLAIVYPDKSRAGNVLKALQKLKSPKLVDLEDAVYVMIDKRGRTRLQELGRHRKRNTIGDGITGLLAGSLLLTPVDGAALTDATDTVRRKVSGIHFEESFTQALRREMCPDSSTVFLLVRRSLPSEVIPRITPYGGTIFQTYLTLDEQKRLEAALKASTVH